MNSRCETRLFDCLHRIPFGRASGRATPDLGPLVPLLEGLPRAMPPVGLLAGIEASIDQIEQARRAEGTAHGRAGAGWRMVLGGLLGAAIAASVFLMTMALPITPESGEMAAMAILAGTDETRLLHVRKSEGGRYLRLQYGGPTARADRDLELWLLAEDEAVPRSLGLLSAKGGTTILPLAQALRAGDELMLSEEPRGGSILKVPSGPVVLRGTVGGDGS